MSTNKNTEEIYGQSIKLLEMEIDYLNKQYTITNAERLSYQRGVPNFQISPYHVRLYEQMKTLNDKLRRQLSLQQSTLLQSDKHYPLNRVINSQNDLIIQRLRQHIFEYQSKIKEQRVLIESQKQVVYGLKNRGVLKKEITSENYGQLKRANEILGQEVVEKVTRNRELEMELGGLRRQYEMEMVPVQVPVKMRVGRE